jgi:hypothetical protein
MSNVQKFYAYDVGTPNNFFSGIWMLTRCMKQAGWTYKASSDGTAKDTSGTAANDKWGGGGTPTSDTYPTAFTSSGGRAGPWWVASGPATLKVPIGVASSGTFLRGESVSQATSGATGELLGYVFDPTNHGWLIISPRTGTFDSTHVITGAISTATVTPNATVKTYTQEVCFWKSTADAQTGNIYWIVADASAESAQLFSTLASAAGCTTTIAPGGGGTSNGFPAVGITILGTAASAVAPQNWMSGNSITTHGLFSAVNATPGAGVSADGTFWALFSDTTSSTCGAITGLFRLDDTEPGDVCPFEWCSNAAQVLASYSRLASGVASGPMVWTSFNSSSYTVWNGYVARGVGTAGSQPDVASYHTTGAPVTVGLVAQCQNPAGLLQVQNHPATAKPMSVDTVSLYNGITGQQQAKGRTRWMRYASIGTLYDTTDSKTWVAWLANSGTTNPAVYIGPWDGATTPAP